jgi:GNAT superfamily N-acetyltransferase
MNAAVRKAVVEDAEAIAVVHIETWQTAYRGQLPDEYLDRLSDDLERRIGMWRSQIGQMPGAKHQIWVAEAAGRVAGFVAFGPAREADSTIAAEVYAIYVNPRNWGAGLGRRLFQEATDRLISHKYATAILWVLESNARARRFYEVAGWSTDGGAKVEKRPDGTELREVRYRKSFRSPEES